MTYCQYGDTRMKPTDNISALKANVTIAHGKGPKWSGYDPNDIHLEAVSLSPDDERNSVFCSVTISAKGIIERIVYVIGATPDNANPEPMPT